MIQYAKKSRAWVLYEHHPLNMDGIYERKDGYMFINEAYIHFTSLQKFTNTYEISYESHSI